MDPTTEVALALHGAPGVYAVLLGSGVSRGAEIPTGWEVTLDLVSRLAAATEGDAPADPARWYVETYQQDPDYSEVLEKLAPEPAERQALLHGYFEPTDEEREEGVKQPTDAHRAVAELARGGFVRVVLSTNFDRLTEQALDAAGVAHDVWHSPDAIRGGVPLSHGRVVVIKLHGDYRDTRLLNTMTELGSYDEAIDQLLDRVLDEFGLIVCGWSGVWDAALRNAVLRAPNRRYRTFWTARHGQVADEAKDLIHHRDAVMVPIEDASRFFASVADKVATLQEVARPHPASVELAVAAVKRHLPDERDRIRLTDTVMDDARRLHNLVNDDERYPVQGSVNLDIVLELVHRYEADAETLLHMLAQLGAHGDRADHRDLAVRVLDLVVNHEGLRAGLTTLLALKRYPALLCFYALGLGAVSTGNWRMLGEVALRPRWHDVGDSEPLAAALHPYRVFDERTDVPQALATGDPKGNRRTPHSDHLHNLLRDPLLPLLDSDRRYDEAFDRCEYLVGVLVAHLRLERKAHHEGPLVPPPFVGRMRWRTVHASPNNPVISWADTINDELGKQLLGTSAAWAEARDAYDELVGEAQSGVW